LVINIHEIVLTIHCTGQR